MFPVFPADTEEKSGGERKLSKWVESHELVHDPDGSIRRTVNCDLQILKSSTWKRWLQIGWSDRYNRYVLFAAVRLEKGAIITVRRERDEGDDEGRHRNSMVPSLLNLGVGGEWAMSVEKEMYNVKGDMKVNAVLSGGILRATTRVMPGREIVFKNSDDKRKEERESSDVKYDLLDCIIYDCKRECGLDNWMRLIGYFDGESRIMSEKEVVVSRLQRPSR